MGFKEDLEEAKKAWYQRAYHRALDGLVHSVETDDLLKKNEEAANVFAAKIMVLVGILYLFTGIGNYLGIFRVPYRTMCYSVIIAEVFFLTPALITLWAKKTRMYMRIALMVCMVLGFGSMVVLLGNKIIIVMVIPVVVSCRYYTRSFTVFVSVLSTILFTLCAVQSILYGIIDLNYVYLPKAMISVSGWLEDAFAVYGVDRHDMLVRSFLRSYLPKYLAFVVVAIACGQITDRSHRMVVEQDQVTRDHSRVESELDVASRIQVGALPIIHDFDGHGNISVFASMNPAKEVGGDFYDIFYLDSSHVALMIADVSDKGVPAALFMMISKLLLDNALQDGKKPAQVLAEVNHQLCEKALEDMFVTVWLGILNLETGELVTANGGHEYPLLCRKDGGFEVIRDKHGLALGVMDGARYKETVLQLEPGDTFFVYTDGVPESNKLHNLFLFRSHTLHMFL